MPQTVTITTPITKNRYVKELAAILTAHHVASEQDLLAVIDQVAAMERQLDAAVKELAAMRRDLAEAERRRHPVANAMRNAVNAMQKQISELRDKLATLKQAVIAGCKNAVAAFKEKGIAALSNIARFFRLRPMLEAVHTAARNATQSADQTIARIETISAEYHEAGRHLKNIGRAVTGKEIIQEAKPQGQLAKTVTAPFRVTRSRFANIRDSAAAAIGTLNRLEERAAQRKPSVQKAMQEYNQQIAETARAAPETVRVRPMKVER